VLEYYPAAALKPGHLDAAFTVVEPLQVCGCKTTSGCG
jgi:hypothetical protein